MGLDIKKNDTVMVSSGDEKGKKGRVIAISSEGSRLFIENVNMIKKHMKPNKQFQQGGLIDKEAPLHMSNVMFVCSKCDKPTRLGNKVLETGRKVRACRKCGEVID